MDREAFKTEVTAHMMGLLGRLSGFVSAFGREGADHGALRFSLFAAADDYATKLEEPAHQDAAAYVLCVAMFGEEEPPETFWRTEAGRAVALAIGYPRPLVPRTTVQHILAPMSRQRVGEMITLGKLSEVIDDGKRYVPAAEVRDKLRARVSGA